MIKAILFDLDDTLLGNQTDRFMQMYFNLLNEYAQPILDDRRFLEHLISSTRATIHNTDMSRTNAEVFWDNFQRLTGHTRADLEPFFERFYAEQFPRLREATRPRPESIGLVETAFARHQHVVIATNPLFPRVAIEQRLEWAGVPVEHYAYSLVTTYENMHAAKPQTAYYLEILDRLGIQPAEALMVGDDWGNDIEPADALGLRTYWVANGREAPAAMTQAAAWGSLVDLHALMTNGGLEALGR